MCGQKCPILLLCAATSSSNACNGWPRRVALPANGTRIWGKGSHGVLIFGDRRTVVRNPKDELKVGMNLPRCNGRQEAIL
jgi:hypothetical protein